MPTWFPPTPPQVDNDVYIDSVSGLLYYSTPMLEDDLPQIHVKKESRKTRTIADNTGAVGVPRKLMRGDIRPPRSLFIRPLSHVKKKEVKKSLLKKQSNVLLHQREFPVLPTLSHDKENDGNKVDQSEAQTFEIKATMNPDWLVNEDWTLLRALQQVLEMPLSLSVLMPAHTPNWDLVSDIVNSISSVYRSPKMCKQRFENVIAPREGNVSSETSFRKKMKAVPKTPVKLKMNKQQKTLNMHTHDGNFQHTSLYSSRFEAISETCSKRTLPLKTSGTGQFQRNPKHTSILMDNGIVYDKPLQPIQVAALRAERISREKQAVEMAKQQQIVQSQVLHQQSIPQITTGQMKSSGVSSGGTNSIIVNSSTLTALKVASPKTTKTAMNNTVLQQTLLRAGNLQQTSQPLQPQIQTHPQNQGAMVTVGLLHCLTSTGVSSITTAITTSNTITQHSLTRPSTSMSAGPSITQMQIQKQFSKQRLQQQTQLQLQKQQKKTVKSQITPQRLQITPEAMKQLRQQQQLGANVVTVAKVSGKQRQTASITPQELQQLLIKNSNMRRSMQKGQTTQVQIAPVQAHVQAQQVQVAAAQQAAQHVLTSKPLPITVPVSSLTSVAGVNLGGVNMSISTTNPISSNRAAPLVVTGQQVPVNIQQQLFQQQHLLKQKMSQQQQNRPVLASKAGKQVFAMVATPLISQSKRQIQQPSSQPPHVVKQAMQQVSTQDSQPGLSQQVKSSQITTQIVQHHQIASAAIVPSTGLNQRLVTGQRQVQQIQQLNTNRPQTILAPASPVISTQQYISGAPQNMAASGSSIPSQQQHVTLFSASKFPQQLQNLLTPSQQVSLHSQQPGCTSQPILHAISSNSQQFLLSQQGNRIQPAPNAVATPMNLVGSSLVQLPVSATSSLNNPLQASSTGGQHTTTQSQ